MPLARLFVFLGRNFFFLARLFCIWRIFFTFAATFFLVPCFSGAFSFLLARLFFIPRSFVNRFVGAQTRVAKQDTEKMILGRQVLFV